MSNIGPIGTEIKMHLRIIKAVLTTDVGKLSI